MKIPAILLLAGSLTLASALAYAAPVTPPLTPDAGKARQRSDRSQCPG